MLNFVFLLFFPFREMGQQQPMIPLRQEELRWSLTQTQVDQALIYGYCCLDFNLHVDKQISILKSQDLSLLVCFLLMHKQNFIKHL